MELESNRKCEILESIQIISSTKNLETKIITMGLKRNLIQQKKSALRLPTISSFYIFIIILGLTGFAQSSPLYDVYRVENEPEPIPMHFLRSPLQIELPENDIASLDTDRFENSNGINKRTRHSGSSSSTNLPDSCCPTIIDVIQPTHGKNRSGDLVELYQSETVRQRFYENSCAPSVADKPCRFLDRKYSSVSRCVQLYTYTYAMVRDFGTSSSDWKLDYIQVRSGCSCHIYH